MSALAEHLRELLAFLDQRGLPPPTREILIVEILNGGVTDSAGRLRIRREQLVLPESFAARFDELVNEKRRWINLSCVGVAFGSLIVCIESGAPGETTGATSINYSGPTTGTVRNGWLASESLLVE